MHEKVKGCRYMAVCVLCVCETVDCVVFEQMFG